MKNILIKVSGDITDSQEFFDFTVEKAHENYVYVICGGGTKINRALEEAGYTVEFDKHGRVTKTWEERMIMRSVLEHEEKKLQDKFVGRGVIAGPPILYAGSVLCPINGDELVKAFYKGFEEIYVFTRKERIRDKQKIFANHLKVILMRI